MIEKQKAVVMSVLDVTEKVFARVVSYYGVSGKKSVDIVSDTETRLYVEIPRRGLLCLVTFSDNKSNAVYFFPGKTKKDYLELNGELYNLHRAACVCVRGLSLHRNMGKVEEFHISFPNDYVDVAIPNCADTVGRILIIADKVYKDFINKKK